MLAATRNKSVLLCDSKNGQILHEMAGHKSRVDGVRFSADGRRVISVGQSQVRLWDARTGTLVKTVQEKKGEIHVIEFSPDGCWFAVAGGKGIISIYDSNSGDKRHEWPGHGCHIWHLAFSADGTRLMSQSAIGKDPATRLWDLASCREVYQAPTDALWKFTPDNKSFILLAKGVIEVRDVNAGELLAEIKLNDGALIVNFAISADKKLIACVLSNEHITVWDISGLL